MHEYYSMRAALCILVSGFGTFPRQPLLWNDTGLYNGANDLRYVNCLLPCEFGCAVPAANWSGLALFVCDEWRAPLLSKCSTARSVMPRPHNQKSTCLSCGHFAKCSAESSVRLSHSCKVMPSSSRQFSAKRCIAASVKLWQESNITKPRCRHFDKCDIAASVNRGCSSGRSLPRSTL